MRHDPAQVASIAATLLQGAHPVEMHHIRKAVASAKAILDEAHHGEPEAAPAAPEQPKPWKKPGAQKAAGEGTDGGGGALVS